MNKGLASLGVCAIGIALVFSGNADIAALVVLVGLFIIWALEG